MRVMTNEEFERFALYDYLYDRLIEDKMKDLSDEECDALYELGSNVKIGVEGFENVTLQELYEKYSIEDLAKVAEMFPREW